MTANLFHRLLAGHYADSLVLMQLQRALEALPGVEAAAAVMATAANRELLAEQGLLPADLGAARPDDLLAVVRAGDAAAATALDRVEALLAERRTAAPEGEHRHRSLRGALAALPAAGWVLVSVPGRWAGGVAREALAAGRHVFLYSDNVPLAEEGAIKVEAARRGLLVLGPDCGTAIVAGGGLGFANRVRRGAVGIVAASGTGLQAVACGLDARGQGISHALGTGGRDLSAEVGGATARAALDLLARDPETRVIVLVSKPPDPRVATRLLAAARATDKPVVVWFLGAAPPARRLRNLWFAVGSDEAAELAAELARSAGAGEGTGGGAGRPGDRRLPPEAGAAGGRDASRSDAGPGAATTAAAALPGGAVGPPGAAAAIGSAAILEASRTARLQGGGGESAAGLPDAEAPRKARDGRGAAASESVRVARPQGERDDSLDAGDKAGSSGAGDEEGAAAGREHRPRWLRGLFSGGTLAAETLTGLAPFLSPLAGNLSLPGVLPLPDDAAGFAGHLVLDLGADEFTAGRPHPMLDPSLVAEQVRAAAADPAVGLLLVDVVLGDGAHADPAGEIAPALDAALAAARDAGRRLEAVVVLVGTEADPQDRAAQAERLEAAGARVAGSVAEALRDALATLPPPVDAVAMPVPLAALAPPFAAVNVGLPAFAAALAAQDVDVVHVDWRPPAGGDERLARILERSRASR